MIKGKVSIEIVRNNDANGQRKGEMVDRISVRLIV